MPWIDKKEKKSTIVKKETKQTQSNSYSIVVGTFKYRNNAEKQLKLIKSKYPKTTTAKKANIVLIKVSGKQLYESRFENFTKKEAYSACKRLKKYNIEKRENEGSIEKLNKGNNKRLVGVIFGGDTGKQRNRSLKIIMDKEFAELGINKKEKKSTIVKKETKKTKTSSYSIVVGTFKYRNNAEKQLKLIKSKYPKTTTAKKEKN